jgi:glutamate---cysteine ligase / carboxylate-amine ligase
MEHAFAHDFTIGVEEELLLTDPSGRRLADASSELIARIGADPAEVRHDIYEAQLELSSPPCRTVPEAVDALLALRTRAREAGATLLGAGIHPEAPFGEVTVTDEPRYAVQEKDLGGLVHRTPDCALHVHVGMPDADSAVRAFNGLRDHLPLLAALAANSPFWHGRDSGLASARLILRRGFPRVEVPRVVRDFEDYEALIGTILLAGELPDYTFVWWDVRLHPKLGTVELRVMDAQSSLARTAGLAALIHGLASHEATERTEPYRTREELAETTFRGCAHGMRARLLDGDQMRPVAELARDAIERARPHARELGSEDALEEVEAIVREGNGADRQRAAYANGGMKAVIELLARETAA